MSVSDPYKVLQVDPEAEREVIEAAYRRLARKYHPDVSPDPDSHQKMIAINMAWEQLRDPVKRAAVDRARQRTRGSAAWVAATDAHARTAGSAGAGGSARTSPPAPTAAPFHSSPGSTTQQTAGASAASFGSMSDPMYAAPAAPTGEPASRVGGRMPIGGFSSGVSSRPDGAGAAGPPPGKPSGSVISFGRFAGWSLGEIARVEPEYLEWLDRMPIGRTYQHEIDAILRAKGLRVSSDPREQRRGGPFRRR